MTYNNLLSKEELEALLTPKELEVFVGEKEGRTEQELTLSPAHLLLALRELEDTVGRLNARVDQLEMQLAQQPYQAVAVIDPVITQVYPLEEFQSAAAGEYAESYIEQQDKNEVQADYQDEVPEALQYEPQNEFQAGVDAELHVYSEEAFEAAAIDDQTAEDQTIENQTIEEYPADDQLGQDLEEVAVQAEIEQEQQAVITNDEVFDRKSFRMLADKNGTNKTAASDESASSELYQLDSSLLSRSARHRERKPSFFSKLLK